MSWLRLSLLLLLPLAVATAQDEENEAASPPETVAKGRFPRYASIKKTEVNVRSGPGTQYPILWIYQRPGYPVQLLTRYDNYYKLRDAEGEEGWVYLTMVSNTHTALVAGTAPVPLYRADDAQSPVVARLGPGLVVEVKSDVCIAWCKVEARGERGWVLKTALSMVD
jgi:SH3-like domain-containing protein